jgi:hypothetical protein
MTLADFRRLTRLKVKVTAGGPRNRTRGEDVITLLELLAEEAFFEPLTLSELAADKADYAGLSHRDLLIKLVNAMGQGAVMPGPTISSITPNPAAGGARVVIAGTNFVGVQPNGVSVAGVAVDSYTVDSPTQITAVLAAGQATGTVRVVTAAGTAASTAPLTITGTPGTGVIGDLYRQTNWTSLNGLESSGRWQAVGGKLVISAGSNEYIRLAQATALDRGKISVTRKLVQTNSGNYGGGIRLQPIMSTKAQIDFYVLSLANSGEFGRMYMAITGGASVGGPTIPGFAEGDTYTEELEFTETDYIYVVRHNGSTYTQEIPINYGVSTDGTPPTVVVGTFKPTIFSFGGAYEISAWSYSSPMMRGGKWVRGDSIPKGFNAGSAAARWPTLAGLQIQSGPGDSTTEVLATMNETINVIQPKKVYLPIGTNDPFGPTYQNQLTSIVNQFDTAGIELVLVTPAARTGKYILQFVDYLLATYPGRVINIFETTRDPATTNLNPAYDGTASTGPGTPTSTADGTHPNAAGHQAIANEVMASPLF